LDGYCKSGIEVRGSYLTEYVPQIYALGTIYTATVLGESQEEILRS
jgi:hypothetical protein